MIPEEMTMMKTAAMTTATGAKHFHSRGATPETKFSYEKFMRDFWAKMKAMEASTKTAEYMTMVAMYGGTVKMSF